MRLIQQSILITFAITSLSGCTTLGPDVCHIDVLWLHNEVSSDFIIDDEHVVMYPAAISGREDNFFSLTFYTYDEDGYYSSMLNLFVPATVGMHDLFSTPPPFMRWELDPSLVLLHADQFNRVYWPTSAIIVVDSLDLRNGGLVSGSLDVTVAADTRLPALIECLALFIAIPVQGQGRLFSTTEQENVESLSAVQKEAYNRVISAHPAERAFMKPVGH